MNIGLIDVDGHGFPNLALMKLSAWHMSKEELMNKICTYTGGRAAEDLIFHSVTTGASNDIEQATKLPGPWRPGSV